MAKRKLKRTLKKEKQWASGSRAKRRAYITHLANLRDLLRLSPKKVEVRLVRSLIGTSTVQRNTAQALGLSKINSYTVKEFTPSLHGMIKAVLHLIDIKEVK